MESVCYLYLGFSNVILQEKYCSSFCDCLPPHLKSRHKNFTIRITVEPDLISNGSRNSGHLIIRLSLDHAIGIMPNIPYIEVAFSFRDCYCSVAIILIPC